VRGRVELVFLGAFLALLLLLYPLAKSAGMVFGTFVDRDFCPRDTGCADTVGGLLWTLPLIATAVLVILIRRPVASWVLRPLPDLTATIEQLGPQNLGQRMRLEQTDGEVRELAGAVNRMLDRVAVGFEGQRRFAANASHELRTPLAVQRTLAEVAMVTGGGEDVQRLAARVQHGEEPAVLRPPVILEACAPPITGPALRVDLLVERIDPAVSERIHPVRQLGLVGRIRQDVQRDR